MKIRNPRVIRFLTWIATYLIHFWMNTLRFRYRPLAGYLMCDRPEKLNGKHYIYAFWHEYTLVPSYFFATKDASMLISQHSDGEIIAQILGRFGYHAIRGSSTRGGVAALLKLVREKRTMHLGMTPDGPRGPRRKVQIGVVYIAMKTGLPIVPLGAGHYRPWRMKSWDRFTLPMPFSRSFTVTLDPIFVPPGLNQAGLEPYRQKVEDAVNFATEIAERWAETGKFDPLGYKPPQAT